MSSETDTASHDHLTLRPIIDADLPFLYRVYALTRWEELEPTGWTNEQKEDFLRQQFMAQHEWWQKEYASTSFDIIERAGAAIGRLYVARWEHELRIVDIALLPEFRGGGLGTRLIAQVIDEAERSGRAVRIHVESYNPAKRLYERLGFVPIEDKGVYLLMERAANGAQSQSMRPRSDDAAPAPIEKDQNRSDSDIDGVIRGLGGSPSPREQAVAQIVYDRRPKR